jgi:magnesium-transporting ATPase (P-type)
MMMKNRLLPFWITEKRQYQYACTCSRIECCSVPLSNNNHCILLLSTQADGLNFATEMLLSTAESATFSASEVERRLHSDLRNGLTWQEALSRSKIIGYNELQAPQEDSTLKKYVEQFKNPLILLLLGKFLM